MSKIRILGLAAALAVAAFVMSAKADKSLGTCITNTAVTQSLLVTPAKDGGFDGMACGTVFFADAGEVTQLRGLCAPCTAATFAGLAPVCRTAYQSTYCP